MTLPIIKFVFLLVYFNPSPLNFYEASRFVPIGLTSLANTTDRRINGQTDVSLSVCLLDGV